MYEIYLEEIKLNTFFLAFQAYKEAGLKNEPFFLNYFLHIRKTSKNKPVFL